MLGMKGVCYNPEVRRPTPGPEVTHLAVDGRRADDSRVVDGAPDALGGERHVEVHHAVGAERVDDRVPHRRGRARRARLADALRAERVPRRGRDRVRHLERRKLGRARNRVVDEARGERVAAVVVDHLLEQRLRGALGDAAVHLRFGEHRVHHAAAVVDRDVPHEPHRARLGVDLDDRDVTAERERPVGVEVDLRLQPGRGRTGVLGRDPGDLAPRDRGRRRAGDAEPAVFEHDDVDLGRFEQVRDEPACGLEHRGGRVVHGAPRELQRTRAERADAVRHAVGVGVHDPYVLERDAEHRRT